MLLLVEKAGEWKREAMVVASRLRHMKPDLIEQKTAILWSSQLDCLRFLLAKSNEGCYIENN